MYYTLINTMVGKIAIAGNETGLKFINFQNGKNPMPVPADWKKNDAFLKKAVDQLNAYFAGELTVFDLVLSPDGTSFQKSVWKALVNIPYGETAGYKDIAAVIGNPRAARAVGNANGKNPLAIVVPCHRIISADGTLGGYSSGLQIKERLLALEKENCRGNLPVA